MNRRNFIKLASASVVTITLPSSFGGCCSLLGKLDLPLNSEQTIKSINWLKHNFGAKIIESTINTEFDIDLICAIACQETAIEWVKWIDEFSPDEILKICIFDASGDVSTNDRDVFPQNTAKFRQVYGDQLTDMLIAEGNNMRKSRKPFPLPPVSYLYKGYGIFQYDLQHIKRNKDFFVWKKWYNFDECLQLVLRELDQKWRDNDGDLYNTIKSYNGSGCRTHGYADNVMQYYEVSKSIIFK